MEKHIDEYDLCITYSHWKSELKEKYMVFPPLSINQTLHGIQSKDGSSMSRIDFQLTEEGDDLIFKDLISGKRFKFELMDISEGKIYFSGESGLKEIWIRQPIDKTSVWM